MRSRTVVDDPVGTGILPGCKIGVSGTLRASPRRLWDGPYLVTLDVLQNG